MSSPGPALPPIQLAVRSGDGLEVLSGSMTNIESLRSNPKFLKCTEDGWLRYSADGALFAVIQDDQVQIYKSDTDPYTEGPITTIKRANVAQVDFSPLGTFLVTWERRVQNKKESNDEPNLRIWNVRSGEEVRSFFQKEYHPEAPPVQWDPQEKIFCFLVSNQVSIVDGKTLKQSLPPIRMEGIGMFMIAPKSDHIATYVPVKKDAPAKVSVFKYPAVAQIVAAKSFFKASSVQLKWNSTGTALLILTATELDGSNSSYYGETGLHIVVADGSFQGGLSFGNNKGPVQAAEWSPSGGEFMVIQGFQPAKIQLFNTKCVLLADLGSGSRNTVIWSPHGRFIAIAGFGNLAGEIDFWDKNKLKKIASVQDKDAPRTWEWTPDSRCLITAVLHPKRRIDNGYKVWSYAGELLYHQTSNRLLQVAIRPSVEGVYPDRPSSPRLRKMAAAAAAGGPAAPAPAVAPKAAYVPPHLRKQGAGPSTIMKPAVEQQAPKKYSPLSPEEYAALTKEKNKKKRERRKNKKAGDDKSGDEDDANAESKEEPKEPEEEEEDLDAASLEKKVKKLKKKLKEIEELVKRDASGETLTEEQTTKAGTKHQVSKELERAEKALQKLTLAQ